MKKINFFSFASAICGRKSSGMEDVAGYKNWKALDGNSQ